MAKDFDFIPAKRSPQKQAARPAPDARSLSKKPMPPKRPTTQRAPQKATTNLTAPKRTHQTRSSLLDYHPLKVPTKTQKSTNNKPSAPTQSHKAALAETTRQVPPYFPPARAIASKETQPKKRFNKKTIIGAVVSFIGIVLLASGMLVPLLENPSVTIIIYIIAAIIFRLNSRVSFSIALLLLLAIPILLLIRNSALAGTYAIFCFYFLAVGVISATIELHKSDN